MAGSWKGLWPALPVRSGWKGLWSATSVRSGSLEIRIISCFTVVRGGIPNVRHNFLAGL